MQPGWDCPHSSCCWIPGRLASCGGGGGEEDGQGLCQACRHKGEEDEGKEERELFQLLGLLVQKGNAALFNNRVPDYGDIEHL